MPHSTRRLKRHPAPPTIPRLTDQKRRGAGTLPAERSDGQATDTKNSRKWHTFPLDSERVSWYTYVQITTCRPFASSVCDRSLATHMLLHRYSPMLDGPFAIWRHVANHHSVTLPLCDPLMLCFTPKWDFRPLQLHNSLQEHSMSKAPKYLPADKKGTDCSPDSLSPNGLLLARNSAHPNAQSRTAPASAPAPQVAVTHSLMTTRPLPARPLIAQNP